MTKDTIIGVDLAKSVFQLHGASMTGQLKFRKKLSRRGFAEFMIKQPPAVVVMEACGSAHYWAREISRLGHEVKLIAPHYVKPFVNKMARTIWALLTKTEAFAQFEREVTGERIRDKVAASKKKGMWMGGNPPLGYDVLDRKLVVNEGEAATVRHVFARYLALGSGTALLDELREQGYRTKQRIRDGRADHGGIPFTRGMLFHLLKNRIYLGQTVHQDVAYPGEHPAIIDEGLFASVQQQIEDGAVGRTVTRNTASPSLLIGLLRDGLNRRMTPTHASKMGKRYRYYVTAPDELRTGEPPAWRLPARDIETIVGERLKQLLTDRNVIRSLLQALPSAQVLTAALELGAEHAGKLDSSYGRSVLIARLVTQVRVDESQIGVSVDRAELVKLLGMQVAADKNQPPLTITAPAVRVRRGKDVKLVFASSEGIVAPNSRSIRDGNFPTLRRFSSALAVRFCSPRKLPA